MSSLKQSTQNALEAQGIPSEYALPAAEILAAEIVESNRGRKVNRTPEQQAIISAAYNQMNPKKAALEES